MKKSMVAGAILLSSLASGAAFASCETNVCFGQAEVITPSIKSDFDDVWVQIERDAATGLACQLLDGGYALLDDKAKQYEFHRAMFMTAIASQSDIRVEFDESSSQCLVSSVEVILPQ